MLTKYPSDIKGDRPENLRHKRIIEDPQKRSDADFINALFKSAAKYKNNLPYDWLAVGKSYNSNSFTAGILKDAAGKDISVDFERWQPGGDKPIPLDEDRVLEYMEEYGQDE